MMPIPEKDISRPTRQALDAKIKELDQAQRINHTLLEKNEASQKALEESEQRFKAVFDTSLDGIIVTNFDSGIIVDVNEAFCRLCDRSKIQIIGTTTMDIGIWKTWTQRREYIKLIQEKGKHENLEIELKLKNKTVSTLMSSKPVILSGKRHLLSTIRDISDRKEIEEQRMLLRKMDSNSTRTDGIVHDFNNLLSGIVGYLEMLDAQNEKFTDNQKDNISNAIISSKKAAKLIRQLRATRDIPELKPAPRKIKTVLVIDDEDMVRDMAVKALESFGYQTLKAENGQVGVQIYKEHQNQIDAVLLDIIMPKMSGVETFTRIKEINPDANVIITSGHITNTEQKKLFTKASAYLDKPYQIMDLKQILREVLPEE